MDEVFSREPEPASDHAAPPAAPRAPDRAAPDPLSSRDLDAALRALGDRARRAAAALARTPGAQRDEGLRAMARAIRAAAPNILAANARDLDAARAAQQPAASLDRLLLDAARLEGIASSVEAVAALPDPVNRVLERFERPNGLLIERVSTPLGVVGVVFESRPNVTADAGAICLKSGNAAVLRAGSDSFLSAQALGEAMREGLAEAGLDDAAIQVMPTRDRAAVGIMLAGLPGAEGRPSLDVLVPRGGKSLVARVQAEARVPVFAHLDGICHVYVHEAADGAMARGIVLNAKMRRVSVCGAAECLLLDRASARTHGPAILRDLIEAGCEVRGDEAARALDPRVVPAAPEDYGREFLAPIIAARVVDGLDEAIEHVERFGSHHTDAIVTGDERAAARFLAEVDSAIVLHNASTQFADGGEFGFGAEIGIATGRLHARGPVGPAQLTSFNYRVRGAGQTRP